MVLTFDLYCFRINLKDMRLWLPRVNYKISNSKLRDKYQVCLSNSFTNEFPDFTREKLNIEILMLQEIEPNMREITFESFLLLYESLMFPKQVRR